MLNILLIIFGILLFNLIIFAHEFGHFFWAKKFGVKVNEFALGMGPRIFKFKKNETIFSLRLLPIGGFCEMEGEDQESDDPASFNSKPAWQKFIVTVFGAIMNLVLGFLLTVVLFAQNSRFVSTTISGFSDDAISKQYGLMENDTITKVNGSRIFTSKDLSFALLTDGIVDDKAEFDIEVKRGNEIVKLPNVNFKLLTNESGKSSTAVDFHLAFIDKNFGTIIKQSFLDTISTVQIVWSSLVGVVTGRFSFRNMAGPIGIASFIGEATTEGLKISAIAAINNIISIMAMITINLGIVNLLPLPALDGGRLIFLLFEMITRKKLNPKYEGWIHAFGFILFLAFMLYISYSDILRLLGRN